MPRPYLYVLRAYYSEVVVAISEGSRMVGLKRKDFTEKAVWVSTFRDGDATIGEAIKQTTDLSRVHWGPPAAPVVSLHP